MNAIGHAWENMVLRETDIGAGDRHLRVLSVQRRNGQASLVNIDDARCFPYWTSLEELEVLIETEELVPVDDPQRATMRRDSELTPSELEVRDRRWEAIRPILEDAERSDLDAGERQAWIRRRVEEIAEARRAEGGPNARGIRSDKLVAYLRLYWRGGQVKNALVPLFLERGAPGVPRTAAEGAPKVGRRPHHSGRDGKVGVNVTADMLAKMLKAGIRLRKRRDETDVGAFNLFTALYCSRKEVIDGRVVRVPLPVSERPTLKQFIYNTDKGMGLHEKLVAQKGTVAVAQRHRARLGNTKHLHFGPGSVYQIDATVGDLYLRSCDDPTRLIGRPVIYLIVDMYAHMIVGFAVALYGPSWDSAALALQNAFSDKVEYCRSLGISIEAHQWPPEHKCNGLMGDRGWDHLSKHAGGGSEFFGYKLSNLPPYRADLKGLVENQFNFVKASVKFVPGDWRARPKGERANKLDGAMTLREFEKFMAINILKRNATHQVLDVPSDWDCTLGRAPTPNMLWAHGVVTHGTPDKADMVRIRQGLLRVGTARTSDRGLMFNSMEYVPEDKALAAQEPFMRPKGKKRVDVEVRYAEADVSRIIVPVERGRRFIHYVRPRNSLFVGFTHSEVADWRAAQTADRKRATDRDARTAAHWDALQDELIAQAKAAGSDEVARTRQPHTDQDARASESRDARVAQAKLALGAPASDVSPPPRPADPPPVSPAQPTLRPNRLATFMKARADNTDNQTEH